MNEKFFNLPQERQDLIRSSAILEFGEGSFKKTSADAIAKRAGVSKALLFHYFKDKRELYAYLFQYAIDMCMEAFNRQVERMTYFGETDFFAALERGHKVKMDMVRRMPGLFRFVMRAYYERDSVLSPRLRRKLDDVLAQSTDSFLARMDLHKFKDGVDPGRWFACSPCPPRGCWRRPTPVRRRRSTGCSRNTKRTRSCCGSISIRRSICDSD